MTGQQAKELIDVEERWENTNGFASDDEQDCFNDVYLLAQAYMHFRSYIKQREAFFEELRKLAAPAKTIKDVETEGYQNGNIDAARKLRDLITRFSE